AAGQVVAYSNEIHCPGCRSPLEVSSGTRVLSTLAGLMAGAIAWNLSRGSSGMLSWILPIVYTFLAFSGVAAVFLMMTAVLLAKPAEPPLQPGPPQTRPPRRPPRP